MGLLRSQKCAIALTGGPVPAALAQLTHLLRLHLADNQLTRPIPPALDQLVWLQELQLAPNPLSGCLPLVGQAKCDACPELSLCPLPSPSLACDKEILLAQRDTLRGSNHERLDNWLPTTPLDLFWGIAVRGDPPRVVGIGSDGWGMGEPNQLAGTIPPALARLFWLEELYLRHHPLTGPIPPNWAIWPSWRCWTFQAMHWRGACWGSGHIRRRRDGSGNTPV